MHVSVHHHTHTHICTHGCIIHVILCLLGSVLLTAPKTYACACCVVLYIQENAFSRLFQPHLLSPPFEVITVALKWCRALFLSGYIELTAHPAIFALNNCSLQPHNDPGSILYTSPVMLLIIITKQIGATIISIFQMRKQKLKYIKQLAKSQNQEVMKPGLEFSLCLQNPHSKLVPVNFRLASRGREAANVSIVSSYY